jgi:Ca2+-binding RTX toxin-like protein
MRGLRSITLVVVIAVITSMAWARQAPSAFATTPDQDVSSFLGMLDNGANSLAGWTQGLGNVGKLADALPAVQTSPGSVLGFKDLVDQWLTNAGILGALHSTDLNVSKSITLGDGRTGSFTSTESPFGGSGDEELDVSIVAKASVDNQPLSVPLPVGGGSNAPQSSFSSTGGVQVSVQGTLNFSLVWEHGTSNVYMIANSSTPVLKVNATAQFSNTKAVKAAIGILGVSLADTSHLNLAANFVGTVSDPNNDGKLAFDAADGGELAQPGSLAGLVSFGLDSPAGSVDAQLDLTAAASQTSLPLPAINAQILWKWLDISQPPPAPTATGIDVAGKFLNMSPKDVIDGIGQLVTSLTMIQQSKSKTDPSFGNIDLPFLKGSLSDVVKVNEILQKFLNDWTFPPCADPPTCSNDPDPSKAGQPKFASLQDFLDALNGESASLPGGEMLTVSDVGWQDPATMNHLTFTLNLTRPTTSPISLNAAAAASTGGTGSTYTQTTLEDDNQNWTTDEWKGHHVESGNSSGTVISNDIHKLTLETDAATPQSPANPGWSPTIPTDGSAYAISGTAGDVGNVELANNLQKKSVNPSVPDQGIGGANAVNSTAMVTPSYQAHVTLVLDLEPPTLHDPPIEVANPQDPTGPQVLASSTPLGADRVMIDTSKTDLFDADFPIDAGIDINANAGFLQVELKGSLHVDKKASDSTDHMLQVHFKDNGLLSFGDLVGKLLNDPASLLDFQVNVGASGSVDASAPGTADILNGAKATATFTWNDLTQTSGSDGPTFNTGGLNPFTNFDFDPTNPKALFSIVLKTLQTLDAALGSSSPSGAGSDLFNKPIPVIGKSLSDLLKSDQSGSGTTVTYGKDGDGNGTLKDAARSDQNGTAQPNAFPQSLADRSVVVGTQVAVIKSVTDDTLTMAGPWTTQPSDGTAYMVRSELDDAISLLQAKTPDNLQALIQTVNSMFKNSTPIQFEYRDDSSVNNTPSLVIDLDWMRKYNLGAPVNFNFNLPGGGGVSHEIAGVQGSGSVSLGISGEIKVGLVVALAPGTGPDNADALQILDNSGINVKLDAGVDNATLTTTLGPLNVSLGDPTSADKGVAHASYSVDLAKDNAPKNGNAESFSQFLQDVSFGVNKSSDAVQSKCGTGFDGEATDLSLCAKLPIYFSTDGGTTYKPLITCNNCSNEFDVRLPKDPQGGADVTDVIDPTGSDIDGFHRIETPDPTALADAIKSTFDFSNFENIDGFINLLQQSLNTASFGGKLPLIGNDLQQGADFLGQLKTTIDSTLGTAAGIKDVGSLRDYVNNTLKNALDGSKLNPQVHLETQCLDTLGSAGAPTVALHTGATAGTTTYTYEIVSYDSDGNGGTLDTQPSPPGDIKTGNATLTGNALDISWSAVTGAEGYKVYRDVTGSGDFELVKDVGNVTTFTDDGSITPSGVPSNPSGPNPKMSNCSFDQLDTVIVSADVSTGKFDTVGDHEELDCGTNNSNNCITAQVPLNIGIPGLSLSADKSGEGPSVQIGYHLHLAFGISRSEGFFIATKDDPQPEFAVGLNFTLPSAISAQLAFINIHASNCDNTQTQDCVTSGSDPAPAPAPNAIPSLFDGTFSIDMLSPNDPTNGHLGLADISNLSVDQLFDVKLHAAVNIDWLLKATVSAPGVDSSAGFPGIQAEFRLKWSFDNVKPGTDDNTSGDNSPLTIEFDKVAIDAGQIFGHLVGPIVQEIKKVTGPLDPVVKTLYAPIPVLSDLSHLVGGPDITIVSIAQAFSTLADGPDLSFVKTIANLITFIDDLPTGTDDFLIPIGSFKVVGGNALNDPATADNTNTLIDQNSEKLDSSSDSDNGNIEGALDAHDENKGALLDPGKAQDAGFSFPVFEKPSSLFNLIMGGDVDLVKFDSGPLTLGFDWRQEFGPVYAPPPVLITLHGSASVTLHIVAGFDTYGIRKAFEAAKAGTLDFGTIGEAILQSLFFYTNDTNGKPMPVVSFTGEIAAGAEVSVVLITVGIEGGVGLTVSFLWNDPNHDGKFRISEFLQTALNNPICLFSVSGQLFVFLKLYVSIGIGPFSVSFSFTIVNVTLLDFSATPDCTPPPPKLGALGDGGHTLLVYAGAFGHTAQRGDKSYDDEQEDKDTVKITEVHDYTDPSHPTFKGIAIDMIGVRREFDNPNIDRVIVDGQGYDKPMSVTFLGDGQNVTDGKGPKPATQSFDKDAIVFGGTKDDTIKTGIGNSWVDGGPGNDTIVTGDRTVLNGPGDTATDYLRPDAKAVVAGGPGDDAITVGNGDDTVAGDSTIIGGATKTFSDLKELVDSSDPSKDQTAGDPSVAAPNQTVPDWTALAPADGTGSGTGDQADGNDTVKVGLGKSTAFGNGGDDTLGVSADDPLFAAHPTEGNLFHSQGATLVGGDGNDHLAGGAGPDTIFTSSQQTFGVDDPGPADTGTSNVVDTGTGNDTVWGSQVVDLVTGHSQKTETDKIVGGDGADVLIGGYGTDQIFGGPGDDNVIAEPSNVDLSKPNDDGFGVTYPVTHQDLPAGITPSPKLLVGGFGKDHIYGGDGGNAATPTQIYGDQDELTPCVAGSPVASDPVSEALNTPQDGADKIIGGNGVDNVRAGGGNDYIDAKGGDDSLCGEKGDDTIHGGDGNDQVWGGTGVDTIYGDSGNDSLYGNDQNDAIYGGDGNDHIEGNDGSDFASGGTGDDVILGGTAAVGRTDEGDFLNGDSGNDVIIGDNATVSGGVWTPADLASSTTPLPAPGGDDVIYAGDGNDNCSGGIGNDFIDAGNGDDHCEGNSGNDTIYGQAGDDELIGGGHETVSPGVGYPDNNGVNTNDTIYGGSGHDVIAGDNAIISTVAPGTGTDTVIGRGFTNGHTVQLLDLGYSPTPGTSGNDSLHGGDDNDVIYGQGGNDTITGDNGDDYAEGGPGQDNIQGNAGNDDLVGGSSTVFSGAGAARVGQPDDNDTISGGGDSDVIIGDNGKILRDGTPPSPLTNRPGMTPQRAIVLYDLTGTTAPGQAYGNDFVTGDDGVDVILGQNGDDQLQGNAGDDYIEGDQGSDLIEGDTGNDDLVGGSSTAQSGSGNATVGEADTADAVFGGPGDDVITGDNASVLRNAGRTNTTDRLGTSVPGTRMDARLITLYDLNGNTPLTTPASSQYGADHLSGGSGNDVIYGQDGNDQISGGPGADYMEGNGGDDILRGDALLNAAGTGETTTSYLTNANWLQPTTSDLEGSGPDGQDDMIGGSSIPAFRDGNDQLEGDGESDFQLGDNGTLKRVVNGPDGSATEGIFANKYGNPAPANAAVLRVHDPIIATAANSGLTTRFCNPKLTTCEPTGAFGNDTMFGDGGDDTMWGQDGNDTMHGGDGNDDMYGELGDDVMFGDNGNDAMLGDRGGIVDALNNGSKQFSDSTNAPPKETYVGFRNGTLDHRVDLLHDIDGDVFVGTSTSAPMPHAGMTEGGNDRMRGGNGQDNIHGEAGDDLLNGDSGGDIVFGDNGADVMWGGKGCDPAIDTIATDPGCFTNGVFDMTARGTNDDRVDHMFGGAGGTSGPSLSNKGDSGADIMDWRPRGSYTPGVGCTTNPWPDTLGNQTVDPCAWFEMTDITSPNVAQYQHHQGTDWMYGGWDRDIMQGDVAANGPNPGDRLLDWEGAYNLYSHCNSAYGGYNDVRQHSPDMQQFLQNVSYGDGAGQIASDVSTSGTSAFNELAFVYPSDNNAHGSGSSFPTTPGHFDQPNACAP